MPSMNLAQFPFDILIYCAQMTLSSLIRVVRLHKFLLLCMAIAMLYLVVSRTVWQ